MNEASMSYIIYLWLFWKQIYLKKRNFPNVRNAQNANYALLFYFTTGNAIATSSWMHCLALKDPSQFLLNLCIVCQESKNDKVLAVTERGLKARSRALTWKGVWGCAALKTAFSRLSCHSQDPQLRLKSIHKILIWKINVQFCLQNQQFSEHRAIFS